MTKSLINQLVVALFLSLGLLSASAHDTIVIAKSTPDHLAHLVDVTKEINPEIRVVDFKGLQPLLEKNNDTTYIINFWATWCAPCIKELPYFQQIQDKYADQPVKVLLVSLDFERQIQSRLIPFIKKHKVTPEVIVLSDADSNSWINKIDSSWSGAIPATLFYNKHKRLFFEKEFTYSEIEAAIQQLNAEVIDN